MILSIVIATAIPSYAAIDVTVQGSVTAEIASEPGNELRAGTRTKLYSEIANYGDKRIKVRLIGLNQRFGELSSFDASSYKVLDNVVNWAEVRLSGNLVPQIPVEISIGNFEVDYSPFTISLKDDQLSEFTPSYINHRGVGIRELNLFGFESSSFILWGFDDINKSAIGGKLSRAFSNTSITAILVDYGYRVSEAGQKIRSSLGQKPVLSSELERDAVKSLEVEQKLGGFGSLYYLFAKHEQSKFQRQDQGIEHIESLNMLKELGFKKTIGDGIGLTLCYREFPKGFNPMFRDRTPEFDERTGQYLGYNPVDRYRDRVGFYTTVEVNKKNPKLKAGLANTYDSLERKNRFKSADFSLICQLGNWEADLFSLYEQTDVCLNTGIRNALSKTFTRLIFRRDVQVAQIPLTVGFELRSWGDFLETNKQGTPFLSYQKNDSFGFEAGVRQTIKGETPGGYYYDLNYEAPNGLKFRYRNSTPVEIVNGKKFYDPDYRLYEKGSIAQLSVTIDF